MMVRRFSAESSMSGGEAAAGDSRWTDRFHE
jgi:hypothetical protein